MSVASDADLVSSMAGRLAMVERELLAAKREIIEKDKKIVRLEKKVAILSRSSQEGEGESVVKELKQRCLEYQRQIADMEVRGCFAKPVIGELSLVQLALTPPLQTIPPCME